MATRSINDALELSAFILADDKARQEEKKAVGKRSYLPKMNLYSSISTCAVKAFQK